MDALSYKTVSSNKATVEKQVVVDAEGHNLGRLCSKGAMILEVSTNQVITTC
jgi:large subunit ribosomal protein L13